VTRILLFLVAVVGSFIAVANTAVIWHGGLFVALMGPWAWGVSSLFDWMRSR
jgi:ABC-type uncharacterized transport system YnjBCD ATPase subunit